MASSTRTVKVKFDGDAKGLQRAAKDGEREIDKFSKGLGSKFKKSGDESGKNFNQSLKKWFSPSSLGKAGKEGGTVFGSGFLGALKTPVLGPAILASLVAAAAVAAPAAGAIAASGLVAGFGAGLAGLGIVFASKSKVVQDTWKRTLSGMGADMQLLSKPFEKSLISIAGFAQRTFDKFKPALEGSFKEIAPAVTRFADNVTKGLEKLAPAIRPMSEAFSEVLDSLGPAMQSAIGNVSSGLSKLADSVKKNPDGLADLTEGVGRLTENALGAVEALNNMNGAFERLTGGTSLVDVALGGANTKVGTFVDIVKGAVNPLSGVTNGLNLFKGSADKAGDSAAMSAETTKLWTQGLDSNEVAATNAGNANKAAAPKVESLAAKFDRQWQATQKANQELFRNSNLLLTLSGSQIGYEAAVDAATESAKRNGKTLDLNTAAGRENQANLDSLALSANTVTESLRNNGDGNVKAAKQAELARKEYVRQAVQMGMNKTAAEKQAAAMIAIPNVSRTAKLNANITDLETKLAAAKRELDNPKGVTKARKTELKAEISKLEAGIAEAKRQLGTVPSSKTVTIWTVNKTNPSGVGRRAAGGPVQPNRSYLVGERGPEILTMGSGGSRIMNAEQTTAALAQSAQPIIVENHIEIGGEVVRVVRTEIKAENRGLKRTVKAGA